MVGAFFLGIMVDRSNHNGVVPICQRVIQGGVILAAMLVDAQSRARRA